MKLLIDFLPIVIFFLVYKMSPEFIELIAPALLAEQVDYVKTLEPIILATAVLIPATLLQILYTRISTGKIEKMHIVTLVLVVILGGATVFLQDKRFIQWKPTLVNWLFALAFLGSQLLTQKPILQRMMESNIELTKIQWRNLNLAWVVFFLLSGAANLVVAFNFSEEIWVDFKLFGLLGLTIIFVIGQSFFLYRYMNQKQEP